ncbi:hypothetical protein [Chryseolinea soli]|uniref:Uncharacterized protein n=1 Tax=Chryseolinea soli TaxID=2321403 RepID=A0A385SM41_9BACT|nr:hypothetical protein [Chryseolinea soli]AYB32044.1 hypothetical protein D4L85_16360 [Chryseolinea soli]
MKKMGNLITLLWVFFGMLQFIHFFLAQNCGKISEKGTLEAETGLVKRGAVSMLSDFIHGLDLSGRGYTPTKARNLDNPADALRSGLIE